MSSVFPWSIAPRDYFLVVSRLVPYKRVELAVEAFTRLGLPLKVVGEGPERERLEAMAGPNVEFLGFVPEDDLPGLISGCLALVFPGEEDFGIVPGGGDGSRAAGDRTGSWRPA